MDNKKLIEGINYWQSCGFFHPLTCGKNSHHILIPKEVNGQVILVCPECDYEQHDVPDLFNGNFIDNMKAHTKRVEELFSVEKNIVTKFEVNTLA